MLIRTITDDQDGRKWDIYKTSDNKFFYKYYEYFSKTGWHYTGQTGNDKQGFLSKDVIQSEFDITI